MSESFVYAIISQTISMPSFFLKDFFVIIILFYVGIGIWHWIKDEFDFGFNLVRVFYFKLSEITTL